MAVTAYPTGPLLTWLGAGACVCRVAIALLLCFCVFLVGVSGAAQQVCLANPCDY